MLRGRGEDLTSVVLLALLTTGKPISVRVDEAVKDAWLIAEVEVIAVDTAQWMGRGGRVRVRVTKDARRIFRGAHLAGREFDLKPYPAGPGACTRELGLHMQLKMKVLVIVAENRMVTLAGKREKDDYRIHGWCDFNACFLYCRDAKLATGNRREMLLHTKRLHELFGKTTRAFWTKVAPHILGTAKPEKLADLLTGLKSDQRARREKAQRALLERGRYSIPQLRAALAAAKDPEEKRRIQAVLDELADYARAHDLAKTLTKEEKRTVLRELADLDGLLEVQRGADPDDHR